MRPMMFSFPKDETTFDMDDQYMLGDALLIKAVGEAGLSSVDVYLPEGRVFIYIHPSSGIIMTPLIMYFLMGRRDYSMLPRQ